MTPLHATLDELKAQLEALRPIPEGYMQAYWQKVKLYWTYHSNALEGNTLTLSETRTLLEDDIRRGNKPERHYTEIQLHAGLLDYLVILVREPDLVFTEQLIKELHALLMREVYLVSAIDHLGNEVQVQGRPGQYKTKDNFVNTPNGVYYYTAVLDTPHEMGRLVAWVQQELRTPTMHPSAFAAKLHLDFLQIHPFDDGNGRMARILMNLILMKLGYTPAIIKTETRETRYLPALRAAQNGEGTGQFEAIVAEEVLEALQLLLRAAKGEALEDLADIDRELALLNRQLKAKVGIEKGKKYTDFNGVLMPGLQKLARALLPVVQKFEQYFMAADHRIQVQLPNGNRSTGLKRFVADSATFNNVEWPLATAIWLNFRLEGFKRNKNRPGTLFVAIQINLNAYNYEVMANFICHEKSAIVTERVTLAYHEVPSQAEIDELALKLGKHLIAEVRKLADL
jgi:Fic family protein